MKKIKHKNTIFFVDEERKNRLCFSGSYCDIPEKAITNIEDKDNILYIQCGKEEYILHFEDARNYMLRCITSQYAIHKNKGKEDVEE